jgi:ElaB/YqjD/DUF883 family membrane-anchored ribosome-binding protein
LRRLPGNKRINTELRYERGKNKMAQSVLKQMGEQIDETTRRASRAASAVADALEDGVGAARRAAKQGGQAATELLDGTKRRVQRHPIESVAATFAVGIAVGAVIGWMTRRRQY